MNFLVLPGDQESWWKAKYNFSNILGDQLHIEVGSLGEQRPGQRGGQLLNLPRSSLLSRFTFTLLITILSFTLSQCALSSLANQHTLDDDQYLIQMTTSGCLTRQNLASLVHSLASSSNLPVEQSNAWRSNLKIILDYYTGRYLRKYFNFTP